MLGWLKRLRSRNEAPPPPAPTPSSDALAPPAPPVAAPAAPEVVRASPPVAVNASIAPAPTLDIPRDKIEARAYEIWVRKGKPPGQDVKNWMEAEAELRAEYAVQSDHEPLPRKSR